MGFWGWAQSLQVQESHKDALGDSNSRFRASGLGFFELMAPNPARTQLMHECRERQQFAKSAQHP